MTGRVLTETQLTEIETFLAKRLDWTPEQWAEVAVLATSHRLLQQQVKRLEQQVEVQRKNLVWFDKQLRETERDDSAQQHPRTG